MTRHLGIAKHADFPAGKKAEIGKPEVSQWENDRMRECCLFPGGQKIRQALKAGKLFFM